MIRRTLLLLCLAWPLAAASSPQLDAWAKRVHARGIQASAGLWEVNSGRLVEGLDVDQELVPASVTKVISTYALLKSWKPNYEITTEVWGDLHGTRVGGDLVFKGAGDPTLVSERIWLLAEQLKEKGVRSVAGRIRVDQGAFDGQFYGNGWEHTSMNTTPAIAPLSVNWNRRNGTLVRDPSGYAVETLTRILRQTGIEIEEGPAGTAAPRRILEFRSEPLRTMIESINKHSNNFMVEMLVKRFGAGTWQQGVRQIQDFYAAMGIPRERIGITDGSGLSKDNRLSAATLATVLRIAWIDFEVGPEFVESLKVIGGEPFGLRKKDANLDRRVRCKTGHLAGVDTVCGYIQGLKGERYAFAVLLNGSQDLDYAWELVSRWAN